MGIIILSIFAISDDTGIFTDGRSLLIVVGGTASASLVTFSFKQLKTLGRVMKSVMRKPVDNTTDLIEEIVKFSNDTRGNRAQIQSEISRVKDPFFKEGLQLVVDRVGEDKIRLIMQDRMRVIREDHQLSISMLRT